MPGCESPVRIELRIVEDDVELTVAQSTSRRIQVVFSDLRRFPIHRFSAFRVEPEGVVSQGKRSCFQLEEDVIVAEQKWIVVGHHKLSSYGIQLARCTTFLLAIWSTAIIWSGVNSISEARMDCLIWRRLFAPTTILAIIGFCLIHPRVSCTNDSFS